MNPSSFAAAAAAARAQSDDRHSWPARLRALPAMLRAAYTDGSTAGGSRFGVTAALAGLAYVISPIDLIPEIVLGPFGFGDDLAIATAALVYLLKATDRYLDREVRQPSSRAGDVATGTGDVVQGFVLDRPDEGSAGL